MMAGLGEQQEISAPQSAKAMARISECSCEEQIQKFCQYFYLIKKL